MNWIRQEKRLAIYLRDGLACVWCGAAVEEGLSLSLDHLRCYRDGGSNEPRNLVTACKRCNSARGARSVARFAAAVASYLGNGIEGRDIAAHVRKASRRVINVSAAKDLISLRGGFLAAVRVEA